MSLPSSLEPEALLDALRSAYGRHLGRRAMHPEGLCALGRFVPSHGIRTFVDSAFFSEASIPALFRFSVGGGNPSLTDSSRTVRGMGVHMCAAGEEYDLVLISEPVFCASTPLSFLSYLQSLVPDPISGRINSTKVAAHSSEFPEVRRQWARLESHAAPFSYATTPYYSTHAFLFVGSQCDQNAARIVVQPDAAVRYLAPEEERVLPARFLESEMDERLLRGPIGFTVYAILPNDGDSLVDCSQEWTGGASIALGRLQVEALYEQDQDMCFIPTRLPHNVLPSADPVLAARTCAYELSAIQRAIDAHCSQ